VRYAATKHNRIHSISSEPFQCDSDYQIIEIPEKLSHINSKDLILYAKVKNGEISSKLIKKSASKMKIALVGNWKMKCGIATYNENLWSEVIKYVGDYKLFIENNPAVDQLNDQSISDNKIVACWKRGNSLQSLVEEIKKYDPDIVWIGHEFGLWPNAAYWLSMMSQLSDYRIIVTMHSIFHHKDKTIIEAAIPEIVVHLQGAHDLLKCEKHIPGKVYVIPHGCFPCTNKERLWNFYKSDHTFMQAGFGFRYKNFQSSIEAVAILKKKFPDIFFTGLFSESPENIDMHQIYYNELMELVEKLNVQENVAFIRGFQSDETLDSYFRTNKVAVFPYVSQPGHEVFGASGAARLAMSANIPVITSSMPHFSDLPTIKADTPENIAQELETLFVNDKAIQNQLLKQNDYINENTWKNIALRYISLFEN
jgi:glycosyltransferase involved in cell wall biosynthesis